MTQICSILVSVWLVAPKSKIQELCPEFDDDKEDKRDEISHLLEFAKEVELMIDLDDDNKRFCICSWRILICSVCSCNFCTSCEVILVEN